MSEIRPISGTSNGYGKFVSGHRVTRMSEGAGTRHNRDEDEQTPNGPSRVIISLDHGRSAHEPPRQRRYGADAGFVAHLIATHLEVPQTRRLRKASPADVNSTYQAVGAEASIFQPRPVKSI